MLVVLLILHLLPQPAKTAMAEAVRDRRSWQAVHTELEPQWTLFAARPESRRPTITLVQAWPVQVSADPRSFSLVTDLPAGPSMGARRLRDSLPDDAVAPTAFAGGEPAEAAGPMQTPLIDLSEPTAPLARPLVGDLRPDYRTIVLSDAGITSPDPGTPPDGPGSGIGGPVPVPEPSSTAIATLLFAGILQRRRRTTSRQPG